MKRNLFKKIISPIPVLLMLFIIFMFSAQNGGTSGGLSQKICEWLVNVWSTVFRRTLSPEQTASAIDFIHPIIRKGAHVTEYLILTFTVCFPIKVYSSKERYLLATETSVFALSKQKKLKYHRSKESEMPLPALLYFTGIATVIFSACDELHQYYVPGRYGCITDVLIDSIGIAIALIIILIVEVLRK